MSRRGGNPNLSHASTPVEPARPSFGQILRYEFSDPESKAANVGVLIGLGLFAGGIVALRSFGDLLVPLF